jgi:tetratricopeptide (TPR) repeat protein
VNSGVLYLKSAAETRFADQKEKDLRDALRVLGQALASGGQQKNPAAWYYLGRYYYEVKDAAGADSAFARAVVLAPGCTEDVSVWRRQMWVPVINAGIAAWQAGNTDSAMATLRRANQLYTREPAGFTYLATLFADANQPDSAAKYFRLAIQAAQAPKYAKDKKDATFNLARVYHRAQRWDAAAQAYGEYLTAYPNDLPATAGLASVYSRMGRRDEAMAMYTQVLQHTDSADASDLFGAGNQILAGIATPPDTAGQGAQCRTDARRASRTLTVGQVAARCDSVTRKAISDFDAGAEGQYRLVEQAYEAGLVKNRYDRDALVTLAGVTALLADTDRALSAAQRLYAVDPLNRATLRKVAWAWQLKGKGDSAMHYLQLGDSIPVEVTVESFTPGEHGATLKGVLANVRPTPTAALTLTFEFLDAKGAVVATQTQSVAPAKAGENQAFELQASGAGIAAWRYRRSP